MKKTSLDAILLVCKMNKIQPSEKQTNAIQAVLSKNRPFILTVDEYLDIFVLNPSQMGDNVRNLLSRRAKFKPMIFFNYGALNDLTSKNFGAVWKRFAPRKIEERDEIPQRPYRSQMFEDGQPEIAAKKGVKHGFERITRAYQSMENMSAYLSVKTR